MRDFVLEKMLDKLGMPQEIRRIFKSGKKYVIPNSREELMELAKDLNSKYNGKHLYETSWYDIRLKQLLFVPSFFTFIPKFSISL